MLHTRKFLAIGTIAVLSAMVGAYAAHVLLPPEAPKAPLTAATLLEPPKPLPNFELRDHTGQPFKANRLFNHWSFLFFGFTNCPGPCPTALTLLASVEKSVSDLPVQQRPQVIFLSVDPKRDTPATLASFVKHFGQNVTGVTGDQAQLDVLTAALGVPSQIVPLADGDYAVDHSLAIFLIDPQGRFHALFSPPQTTEAMTHDYRILVADGASE
jgi:protein SCO1/2